MGVFSYNNYALLIMGTRSAIGYELPSGKIKAAYCHWDGSPRNQLPILNDHYKSIKSVQALIKPGSMSSLLPNQADIQYHGDGMPARTCASLQAAEKSWANNDCEFLYWFDRLTETWEYCRLT